MYGGGLIRKHTEWIEAEYAGVRQTEDQGGFVRRNRYTALAATMALVGSYTAACSKGLAREAGPRYAVVGKRDIVVSANAAGVIEPVATVEVKSQASGEITEITINEGDQVKRGQLLVRVDPRVPRAAVAQATADSVVAAATLRNAEAQLQRAGSLHDVQALTTADLEAA
jgi:multidrug efflux pump subunit AcrA (membrane-fusion protein)